MLWIHRKVFPSMVKDRLVQQAILQVLRELDKWLRHKLRCVRLKQGKRRYAIAQLLIGQGLPAKRAWLLALSGKGWWRLSQSPQAQEAFSTRWFEILGLVSLEHQHAALQLAERNRRIR